MSNIGLPVREIEVVPMPTEAPISEPSPDVIPAEPMVPVPA